jgi:ABC-type transporter MlaC component
MVAVPHGANQTFTVTPATGYQVSDVQMDGVSVGKVNSYLFGNVMSNHTIGASFQKIPPGQAKKYFSTELRKTK